MLRLTRFQLQRYGVAVLAVVVALLLTELLWEIMKPTLYPLFLAAVMVSSWYGGIGPGLVTIVLSTLACSYFFLPPLLSPFISRTEALGLFQFVLVALLIGLLNWALRSTQRQAEKNAIAAQRNYERLLQSQESLSQSEQRYRLLVEGLTNYAVFMMDTSGRITSWNVGAERILGYQESEIIGQPLACIFTPEAIGQGVPEQALTDAVTYGMSRDDRWHVRKDGKWFWANGVITPLRDEQGNLRCFVKILQDLTERKQAEEEREELLIREQTARAEAEAANRSKDEFLAVVSHELRTPMTAIVGWAGMLQTGMLDKAKAALAIETIERNANLQMQLIEDLLDISRIIRGEISLNWGLVDLVEVITAAIEVVQPGADAKAIQLEPMLDTSLQAISGDPDRLQQVVLNLLSNAIKFTLEGGRVEIRLERVEERRGAEEQGSRGAREMEKNPSLTTPLTTSSYAQIQFIDTGQGIGADFLPFIFDRFRQADTTSARSHKGLGLGLAIARHLVELHGGTIQADSPGIGQGATFTLKLPIPGAREDEGTRENPSSTARSVEAVSSSSHQPVAPSPSTSSSSLAGLRVLIVDDEADTREWIKIVLEKAGAEAIAVGAVGEALQALEQLQPHVMVSDIGMPGEDGYALIRKIRELAPEKGGRIPAVALTGYARVADYKEALSAGFQLHVAKPIRAGELVAVVTSLTQMSKKSKSQN